MFKEHVSKLTDNQLKKYNRLSLGIAIGFLIGMIALIGLSLMQISNQNDSATFSALVPIIIIIPLLYSSILSSEIKKEKTNNFFLIALLLEWFFNTKFTLRHLLHRINNNIYSFIEFYYACIIKFIIFGFPQPNL